jgi:hypothetical protein
MASGEFVFPVSHDLGNTHLMELAVKQKSKMITLIIANANGVKSGRRFRESDYVEKILLDAGLNGMNVHPYYNGKRLLEGRLLSSYNLPDGASIDLCMSSRATTETLNLAHHIIVIVPGFREMVRKFLRHVFHLPDTEIETLFVIIYLFCVAPAYRLSIRRQ